MVALSSSFLSSSPLAAPFLHLSSRFDVTRTAATKPAVDDVEGFSRVLRCAVGPRPRKASGARRPPTTTRSTATSPRYRSTPKRAPAAAAPAAGAPPKKRHWKEGEFPGISESSISRQPRTPIKNLKKKADDRAAAKAWACTVTEALADRIQKKQWQEALEVLEFFLLLLLKSLFSCHFPPLPTFI
ncbi:hypothetical protein BHM03_00001415 [Ensete ventricosum]|nr:hypothetical protein BHM03_00001415 [Ensete ventricosum]